MPASKRTSTDVFRRLFLIACALELCVGCFGDNSLRNMMHRYLIRPRPGEGPPQQRRRDDHPPARIVVSTPRRTNDIQDVPEVKAYFAQVMRGRSPLRRPCRTPPFRWSVLRLLFLGLLVCQPRSARAGGGGARATDGRPPSPSSGGQHEDDSATTSTSSSSAAVVICSVDGTVYTLDPWSGNLRGIFASGPALISSSTDNNDDSKREGPNTSDDHSEGEDEEGILDDDDNYEENRFEWEDGEEDDASSTDERSSSSNPQQQERIVPGLDGNLYSLLPPLPEDQSAGGLRLERLPISVAEAAEAPISTCSDAVDGSQCSLVMGEKQTKIFRLDPATGRVVWMQRPTGKRGGFTAADSGMLPAPKADGGGGGADAASPPTASVLLQREDYLLRSVDSETGEERWNVTLGRFSALDFGGRGRSAPGRDGGQSGSDGGIKASSSAGIDKDRSHNMPELPHRLTDLDTEASHGDDDTESSHGPDQREPYMLGVEPLPSVAFGDEGTTVIAISSTGKILWQREMDSVVAAVYGVEQNGPDGQAGGWSSLDVIEDFNRHTGGGKSQPLLESVGDKKMLPPPHANLPPIERLSHSSRFDAETDGESMPPTISPDTLQSTNRREVSSALIPYGYGQGVSSWKCVQ